MTPPRPWLRCCAMACLAALLAANGATTAEPTEPERLHSRLAETEGRSNKLLASRWQAMIRQRQWVDSTGKHKVYARYVDHDADLKSVTLLVLVKAGEQQSYREKTVPLARLGKNEQALVKRIAIVRKEVEAAVAAAPAGEAGLPGESLGESPPFAGEGRGAEIMPPALEPPALSTPDSPPPRPVAAAGGKRDRNAPTVPDNAPWRTDFATFASHLSAQQGADGTWILSWGELKQLEAACGIAKQFAEAMQGRPRPPGSPGVFKLAFVASAAQVQLGEVMWETTLAAPIDAGTAISHDLQLPAPLSILLIPEETDAGDLSRFNAGDRVRLIGRFADLWGPGETPVLTLRVRFPDDQPSPAGDESRDGYSGEETPPSGGVFRPGT